MNYHSMLLHNIAPNDLKIQTQHIIRLQQAICKYCHLKLATTLRLWPTKGVTASKIARISFPGCNSILSHGQIWIQSPTHHHHQIYPHPHSQDCTSEEWAQATCSSNCPKLNSSLKKSSMHQSTNLFNSVFLSPVNFQKDVPVGSLSLPTLLSNIPIKILCCSKLPKIFRKRTDVICTWIPFCPKWC